MVHRVRLFESLRDTIGPELGDNDPREEARFLSDIDDALGMHNHDSPYDEPELSCDSTEYSRPNMPNKQPYRK